MRATQPALVPSSTGVSVFLAVLRFTFSKSVACPSLNQSAWSPRPVAKWRYWWKDSWRIVDSASFGSSAATRSSSRLGSHSPHDDWSSSPVELLYCLYSSSVLNTRTMHRGGVFFAGT